MSNSGPGILFCYEQCVYMCVCVCTRVCAHLPRRMCSLEGRQRFVNALRRGQLWLPAQRPLKVTEALDRQGLHQRSRPAPQHFVVSLSSLSYTLTGACSPIDLSTSDTCGSPAILEGRMQDQQSGAAFARTLLWGSWISFPEFLFNLGNWAPRKLSCCFWSPYHRAGLSDMWYYSKFFWYFQL